MKLLRLIVLAAGIGLLTAAEAPVQPGAEPLPGEGPRVRLQPLLPRPSATVVKDRDRLLRHLESMLQNLDHEIDRLLARYDGSRPATLVQDFPELQDARQKRDASWEELQAVLDRSEEEAQDQDPLDVPASQHGQDVVERRLAAQNTLAIAKCYYELATAGARPDPAALTDGRDMIDSIAYEDLPIAERPFVHYYRFAFALEQGRRSDGERAAAFLVDAQRHQEQLQREFPDSYLTTTAASLLANADFNADVLETVEPEAGLAP